MELRDIIIFLTGAQAFHTLGHILIRFTHTLPIKVCGINWTQKLNNFAVVINLLITVALFWWLYQH